MTSGEAGKGYENPERLRQIREKEARNATQKIGITDIIFLREKDGFLRHSRRYRKTYYGAAHSGKPKRYLYSAAGMTVTKIIKQHL